ncbi:DJ-1/PfpI family protein [Nocardia sp. 004]|uniref:DJ-1/PfpI family protein n=1 Tax=Nocardia sp. 004 TaxID=3385978 RepID=UPI0039A173E7
MESTNQRQPTVFDVVVVLFDGVTQLDYVGPVEVFGRCPGTEIHLAARKPKVSTDQGAEVLPTCSLEAAPQASVLVVPGGPGAIDTLSDPELLTFVETQSAAASWTCSVCTGSFILGAAGLLRGRRATTHWASHAMLAEFGCLPVDERVVVDRPVVTSAGVSAGIDMALGVAGEIFGPRHGAWIELAIEYAPHPPFGSGDPRTAPSRWVTEGREVMARDRLEAVRKAAQRVRGRS